MPIAQRGGLVKIENLAVNSFVYKINKSFTLELVIVTISACVKEWAICFPYAVVQHCKLSH